MPTLWSELRYYAELPADLAKDFENSVEVFLFVRCHVTRSQHLHTIGNAWANESIDEDAGVKQLTPEYERVGVVADDHRNDPGLPIDDVEAQLLEPFAHFLGVADQPVNAPGFCLEDIERGAIVKALEQTRYNKTAAAKLLGMSFRALRYRIKKLGIE